MVSKRIAINLCTNRNVYKYYKPIISMGKIGYCWNKGLIHKEKVICQTCKKEFEIWKCRKDKAKFCSNKCYSVYKKGSKPWNTGKTLTTEHKLKIGEGVKGKLSGDKNPNWLGGIDKNYPNEFRRYLRFKIKERDNYTCNKCGSNKMLIVHHIDKDKKNNNLSNLITLCKICHGRLHAEKEDLH